MKISILELLPNVKKTRKFFETGKKKITARDCLSLRQILYRKSYLGPKGERQWIPAQKRLVREV